MLTSNSLASTQPRLQCHEEERSALLQFRQSFVVDCSVTEVGGYFSIPSKPKVASWNNHEFVSSNTSSYNCCTWDGVWCSEHTGHVIGLNLGGSCLYGSFPQNSSLFKLTHLQHLDLSGNNFKYSHIPQRFGHLVNLKSLDLSVSQFSGHIPLEISQLYNLRTLDLSYSTRVIPYRDDKVLKLGNHVLKTLLNNLTRLNALDLSLVDISSNIAPITTHLLNHTSLIRLSLILTKLRGELPSSIFRLPRLEYLDLSRNDRLTGVLPQFQRNCTSYNLIHLDLSQTGFSGKLPTSLGDHFTKLKYIDFTASKVIGEVPLSFVNLTGLLHLGLSNTSITITPSFFNLLSKLNKLTYLHIDSLHFVEPTTFPPCLRNMTKLETFRAQSCQFIGPIPSWLSNLTQLNWLDLFGNDLSKSDFNIFLQLKSLTGLILNGISLNFRPINITHNRTILSNIPQVQFLGLGACDITEFPEFLKFQHELRYLDLSRNHIRGLLPQWLVSTSKDTLQVLDMSSNILTGFEQSDPLINLPWSNIQFLDLSNNKLRGSVLIPPISLWFYLVGNNSLAGDIPVSLCNNTLRYLDLSYNNLSGRIPQCFDKLGDSLVILDLQGNRLQGTSPQNFGKSCTLKAINLSKNQLEGKLPRSLANCSALHLLDIGYNAINDTFPTWLGNLHDLQILVLRHNRFHGAVLGNVRPRSNDEFFNLRILDMSNNFHIGSLPVEYIKNWPSLRNLDKDLHYIREDVTLYVGDASVVIQYAYTYKFSTTNKGTDTVYSKISSLLKVLDLSSNNFTGRIEGSIGQLKGLVGLNLSNNHLTGEIPSSLANLKELECLDLSHNKLYGEIPDELIALTFLEILNVSNNHLMGSIPHGSQFDTFDHSSFDGNPRLCGKPLSKKCKDTDESLPLPPPSTHKDFVWVDWMVRLLGYGSGLVVGIVGGKIFTDRYHEWFMETFGRKHRKRRVKGRRRSYR